MIDQKECHYFLSVSFYLSQVVAAVTVSPLHDMLGSQAGAVRLGGSLGRRRIGVVRRVEGERGVEGRRGRYEVQYVGVAPLSVVSSVFVLPGPASHLLATLIKTLTGSFQSLLVS